MNDLEVLAAVVVVLAVLGWAAAGMGWLEGSVTVRVIPPSKRPQKPEQAPAAAPEPEGAAKDAPEPAPVDEPVPLHGEAA